MTSTGVGRCSYGAKKAWGVAERDSKDAAVVILFVEVVIIFTKAIIIFVEVIIIFVEVPSSGVEMVIIFAGMVINLVEVSTA